MPHKDCYEEFPILKYTQLLVACCIVNTIVFFFPIRLFFLPDIVVLSYVIYKFKDINQDVSSIFYIGLALFLGYLFLSPEPSQTEYVNNFLVPLKPFVYLCIMSIYSRNIPSFSIRNFAQTIVVLYPLILLWNASLYYIKFHPPLVNIIRDARPYFMFENNFEITLYINCFVILFFIFKLRDIKYFVLMSATILLAGSRSGLLSFAVVCIFYFADANWKQRAFGLISAAAAFTYVAIGRNITEISLGNIDRLQTLNAMLTDYNHSFVEILKVPFGHGIYQKIPMYICEKLPYFAEWFNGNSNNCDPIMMQAFYSRALFEYGIYITILIPVLFFLLIRRETGSKVAFVIMAPITCVASSVGGFSNGIAFIGVMLSIYAYIQSKDMQQKKLKLTL